MNQADTAMPLPDEDAWRPRTAVVTGSDSGIGRAVAVALAGGGADVGITYHADEAGAKHTAAEAAAHGVVHEHAPWVGAAPYCAAKAGVGMLTKVLAMELAEHHITVNSVALRQAT